jgi:outer membrane protein OmpA-like peptidoglycan-associated protein
LIRPGFTLVNWNTKADGSGTPFVTGSALTLSAPLTLFAQWTGHTPALVLGAVGSFAGNTTILTNALKAQVQHFSVLIKARKYVVVTLYGYTTNTGLASRNVSISRQRANAVAAYLRRQLQLRNVTGVAVKTAGEGTVAGASSSANRRVEVFCY